MECIDSLLVILDYMDDCYFHVYTLSGNPKGKFARKGQGPGELLFSVGSAGNSPWIRLYVFMSRSTDRQKVVARYLSLVSIKLIWDLKMLMREMSLFMRCCMRKEMRWSLNRSLCLTGRGTLLRKCGPVSVWHVFVWTRRIMSFMHWHRMKKTAIRWYVFAVIK